MEQETLSDSNAGPIASGSGIVEGERPTKRARFEEPLQVLLPASHNYMIPSPTSHHLPQSMPTRSVPPEQLAAASLHNPDDAVNLLVLASSRPPIHHDHLSDHETMSHKTSPSTAGAPSPSEAPLTSTGRRVEGMSTTISGLHSQGESFPLIKLDILRKDHLDAVLGFFFSRMHSVFPIVPVW